MGRLRADSAERIIELSKAGVSNVFIRQIIIAEDYKHTSSETVRHYSVKKAQDDCDKEKTAEVPFELLKQIRGYFNMREEIKATEKSILDQLRCIE